MSLLDTFRNSKVLVQLVSIDSFRYQQAVILSCKAKFENIALDFRNHLRHDGNSLISLNDLS